MLLVKLCIFFAEFLFILACQRFGSWAKVRECPYGKQGSGRGPCQYCITDPFRELPEIIR